MSDKFSWVRDRLLEAYSADEYGTWKIKGEDPNCDLGGAHSNPELEVVKGTYRNVVEYALHLKDFFTWGGGGSIVKMSSPNQLKNIDKIYSFEVLKLKDEREKLLEQLAKLDTEIEKKSQ